MRAKSETECDHCKRPLELEVDSELRCRVVTSGVDPLVSLPLVNLAKLEDLNIIDAL